MTWSCPRSLGIPFRTVDDESFRRIIEIPTPYISRFQCLLQATINSFSRRMDMQSTRVYHFHSLS